MEETNWDDDAASLERDRQLLKNLETALGPGKTVTYEASDSVDTVTQRLLERSWRDSAGDPNRQAVEALLMVAQTLRRNVSKVPSAKYEQEYQSWIQSWKQE